MFVIRFLIDLRRGFASQEFHELEVAMHDPADRADYRIATL
jgi:hypothetical protein